MSIVSQAVMRKVEQQLGRPVITEQCIDDILHENRIVPVYAMRVASSPDLPSWRLVLGNLVLKNSFFSCGAATTAWKDFRNANNLKSMRG